MSKNELEHTKGRSSLINVCTWLVSECSIPLFGSKVRLYSRLSSLNFRISISCLLPASWHFSISPVGCPRVFNTTLRQIVVIGILAAAVSLLYYSLVVIRNKYGRASRDKRFHRWELKRLWERGKKCNLGMKNKALAESMSRINKLGKTSKNLFC